MTHKISLQMKCKDLNVKLIKSEDAKLMRFFAVLLALIGNDRFLRSFWCTIGRKIYYPQCVTDPWKHVTIIEHELVHVQQWIKWRLLFAISYLLLPLPFGLAWCRWRFEREAYLINIRASSNPHAEVAWVVESLWSKYGWTWPKPLMRKWFMKQIQTTH